jgi:hypothetical protein
MAPDVFFSDIVVPSLKKLAEWTGVASDDRAHALVMTIAGQESGWKYRRQLPIAYARGYWECEVGGAVTGVLANPASAFHIRAVCAALDIQCDAPTCFEAIAWNDTLACCFARLLLYTDPAPLPAVGDVDGGWSYYQRVWRPGAPRPGSWPERYDTALKLVKGQS